MTRPVCLIANPSAGGGRTAKLLPAVEAALRGHGVEFRTERTRSLEHARELARTAAESGEVAVTLSGDGLVGCVAGVLRDMPGSVMGVLPGGRGNDFARALGISQDIGPAVRTLLDGEERALDLGDANGRAFASIASVGFDSDANRIANEAPAALGRLVYAYGAIRALVAWREARFAVDVDGEREEFAGWSVAAANSGFYGGGMRLAPDARLDDGALDVVSVAACSRLRHVTTLPRVFRGTHLRAPYITVRRGAEVRVSADRPFTVYADGDPIGALPVTLRAVPAALRILLPA